ncbi:MAG: tetratricopeptide repeat protein [Pseudomonadota bacterium]
MTTRTLRPLLIALCLVALALALAGCRSARQPQTAPEPVPLAAGASESAAPAGPADPSLGQRRCLRILPQASQAQAESTWQRIQAGEHFLVLAREMSKGGKLGPPVRCLYENEMETEALRAVKDLRLGQTSPPFLTAAGWALALCTTDEYWQNGNALYDQGRFEQAEAELLKDVEINPDGPSWHLVALCRSARKDTSGALAALDQALSWAPLSPSLLNDKASLLMDQGRLDEAAQLYEEALRYAPDNPLVMNNLAWCLARNQKDLARAAEMAKRAVARQPDRAEFWDTLGMVQQMAGHPAQAAASYGRALKLNPEMAQAKANLVPSLLSLDNQALQKLLLSAPAAPAAPAAKRLAGPGRP